MREVFNESGLKIMKGDEAFYYRHYVKGNLNGMVSSYRMTLFWLVQINS